MKNEKSRGIVLGSCLALIGVLFIVQQWWPLAAWVIAIGLLIIGVVLILVNSITTKKVLTPGTIAGAVASGIGLMMIISVAQAGDSIELGVVIGALIYILLFVGALILAESVVSLVKEKVNSKGITLLVIGALLFTFSILLVAVQQVAQYTYLIIGIVVALIGIYQIIASATNKVPTILEKK